MDWRFRPRNGTVVFSVPVPSLFLKRESRGTPPRAMPRRRDDDDDDDDDDDEKALWDALGRGTAAGRAVFNLYSGDSGGKEYGAFANDFNRLQMRVSDPATRRAPPEVEEAVKKETAIASAARTTHARVRRPTNFTGAPPLTDAEAVRASFEKSKARRPGVRPKALSDLENAARREEAPLPPAPSRRLIGEQGKLRFQRLREFNGRLPEEQPENVADARRAREESAKPKTTRETAETLFSQVALEIEEREVFLAEMRAAGIGARYETVIRAEIAERVQTLRRLDGTIRAEEAKEAKEGRA
jgi:hypothetical protein